MTHTDITKYLPLTEATYYILLALAEPLHGYAVMQKVGAVSDGTVSIGPGTLYGAFSKLEQAGLVKLAKEEDRRKCYALTDKGRELLAEQIRRVEIMSRNGQAVLPRLTRRTP